MFQLPEEPTNWLVEEGIGEERALKICGGRVVAARVQWPGRLAAGQVEDALLVTRYKNSPRGIARFASGEEALVDRLPRNASMGARVRLEVTRASVAERTRNKLAQARPTDAGSREAPALRACLAEGDEQVQVVHRFPDGAWEEVWSDAWQSVADFAGGSLHLTPAAAMTLIDIDGRLPPRELSLEAVPAIAAVFELFDLSGSVGIDFPTLPARADRKAVDEALDRALSHLDYERTSMNGFGFVQIVSRAKRPSLLHTIAHDRAGAAARFLLRRAERLAGPGLMQLTGHPRLLERLLPAWLEALSRRTGHAIQCSADPALALDGGYAQMIPA